MLIRIKQIRLLADGTPGTDVLLGPRNNQRTLQFRPLDPKRPDQDHVCDVTDPEDIARLLAIHEGYEVHESELKGCAAPKPARKKGSGLDEEVVAAAPKPARKKPARKKGGGLDGEVVADAPKPQASDGEPWYMKPDVDRPKLIIAVAIKTGKVPHPATSVKKLQEALAE